MRRCQSALLLVAFTLSGAVQAGPKYKLDTKPAQRIEATLTFEVTAPNFKAQQWGIFVAKPPDLPSQVKVRTILDPKGTVIHDTSTYQRDLFAVTIPALKLEQQQKFHLTVKYQATLLARRLVSLDEGERPPMVPPLDAAERKRSLALHRKFNFKDKAVQKWLADKELKRHDKESEVDFVARVITVLRGQYTYAFYDHDRTASALATADRTDCAGLTTMLVTACRANGIPARLLVGRLAKSRDPKVDRSSADFLQVHVRCEVFAEGIGWVPMEPTNAVGNKARPLMQYVGNDAGDLLVFHVDEDFNIPGMKDVVSSLQIPAFMATGQGNLDGRKDATDWQVQVLPNTEVAAVPDKPAPEKAKPAEDQGRAEAEARKKAEDRAASLLRYAKKLLANAETAKGRQRLEEIVKDFADTKAGKEARELLDKLPH
jgi:transglutaminase-like putative cysteine protease